MNLPRVIVARGGRPQDVGSRVTIRFEPASAGFEARCAMRIEDVSVESDGVPTDVFVEPLSIPRAFYDAVVQGMEDEIRDRVSKGMTVAPLQATLVEAVVHPVDARIAAHREAGRRAIALLLDEG